jgi:hypothetical protein
VTGRLSTTAMLKGRDGIAWLEAVLAQISRAEKDWRFSRAGPTVTIMSTILCALASIFEVRIRSRASLELELVALRHQLTVLRRRRPGRPQLSSLDRLLCAAHRAAGYLSHVRATKPHPAALSPVSRQLL